MKALDLLLNFAVWTVGGYLWSGILIALYGTRQAVARFEAGRQALALMDPPKIAKATQAELTEKPGSSSPRYSPTAFSQDVSGPGPGEVFLGVRRHLFSRVSVPLAAAARNQRADPPGNRTGVGGLRQLTKRPSSDSMKL